jgi:hypothetical protein
LDCYSSDPGGTLLDATLASSSLLACRWRNGVRQPIAQ